MAVKIIANYSKRLGLPGYSSHQFSVSVETELTATENVTAEASRLYQTLQQAVDREMQRTGFVPEEDYGQLEESVQINTDAPHKDPTGSRNKPWKASDKQRELVLKVVQNNSLDLEVVESISDEMFGHTELADLNKIQMSGLIDELLSRYGKRDRRELQTSDRFKGRTLR
jgi:hypothetical protein